jgi:hypothetical protein
MALNVKTAELRPSEKFARSKFFWDLNSPASSLGKGRVERGLFFPAYPTSNDRPYTPPYSPYS